MLYYKKRHVEFVSYTGRYPNLCRGELLLEIDGKQVLFGLGDHARPIFWTSGGYLDDEYYAHTGEWVIDIDLLPEEYRKYSAEIDRVFNDNVPWGCCGGCA